MRFAAFFLLLCISSTTFTAQTLPSEWGYLPTNSRDTRSIVDLQPWGDDWVFLMHDLGDEVNIQQAYWTDASGGQLHSVIPELESDAFRTVGLHVISDELVLLVRNGKGCDLEIPGNALVICNREASVLWQVEWEDGIWPNWPLSFEEFSRSVVTLEDDAVAVAVYDGVAAFELYGDGSPIWEWDDANTSYTGDLKRLNATDLVVSRQNGLTVLNANGAELAFHQVTLPDRLVVWQEHVLLEIDAEWVWFDPLTGISQPASLSISMELLAQSDFYEQLVLVMRDSEGGQYLSSVAPDFQVNSTIDLEAGVSLEVRTMSMRDDVYWLAGHGEGNGQTFALVNPCNPQGEDNSPYRDLGVESIDVLGWSSSEYAPGTHIAWADEIEIAVRNHADEPVTGFSLGASGAPLGGHCDMYRNTKWFPETSILPGESVTVTWESLPVAIVENSAEAAFYDLCVWTIGPNGQRDDLLDNDQLCTPVLYTSVGQVSSNRLNVDWARGTVSGGIPGDTFWLLNAGGSTVYQETFDGRGNAEMPPVVGGIYLLRTRDHSLRIHLPG